jgi:hypothetical protein
MKIIPRVRANHQKWTSLSVRQGVAVLVAALTILIPVSASALTTLSQGFTSSSSLPLGAIVSLQNNSTDHVEAASVANVNSILGIVIDGNNSLLSLSSGQAAQVQVANSGIVQVLVSDLNGAIAQGDQITASGINGVGMKASTNVKTVGIAQGSFPNSTASHQSYSDKQGHKHDVVLGQIPVQIAVSYFFKQPDKTIVPSAVQNVANALAGKSVSSVPILVSGAIFLITLIVVMTIIYSMIRGSIISVGRNPMSQSAIYRDIIQLSVLVLAILGVSMGAIYEILTRF